MKITRIDLFARQLPYNGDTYTLSGGREYTAFQASIVRMQSDDGFTGWGESTPFGSTYIAAHAKGTVAGIEELAPVLLGQDPRCHERLCDLMDQTLLGHNHARAALDIACWDLAAQHYGVPVNLLLGGSTGERMPVISSIYSGTPDDMRSRVAEHRTMGYRGHSIKIGATEVDGGPPLDAERISACLADRQPGEYFLADANGGMSVEAARRFLTLLPAQTDIVLEAPCKTWQETLSLRQHCRLPIMLDELIQQDEDVIEAIRCQLTDGIGLKISKAGGLTPAKRQRDICRAAGLSMSVQDTVGSSIAFAGIVHLAQTVPGRLLRCVLDTRDMVTGHVADLDVPLVEGGVMAPESPGLGLKVNLDSLGQPVNTWTL